MTIHALTKLTSQRQVSVPASVRRTLGLTLGAALEWVEERGRIVVKRATRHDFQAVREALFPRKVRLKRRCRCLR